MLVDLETVRRNLKAIEDIDDDNIVALIKQASAIILDYLELPQTTYVALPVPELIQAAVLMAVRALYDTPEIDPITPAVKSILMRSRLPAMA